jgi:hypothetical protein
MEQVWERLWPYLAGVVVTAIWWCGFGAPFPDHPDGLLAASGGASAVLVGFLATAKTIILSVGNTEVFARFKAGGFTRLLFSYLYEALLFGIMLLVVSIMGFFVAPAGLAFLAFSLAWMIVASWSLMLYLRITHLLFKLLEHV